MRAYESSWRQGPVYEPAAIQGPSVHAIAHKGRGLAGGKLVRAWACSRAAARRTPPAMTDRPPNWTPISRPAAVTRASPVVHTVWLSVQVLVM
jgi:hypothetical protein